MVRSRGRRGRGRGRGAVRVMNSHKRELHGHANNLRMVDPPSVNKRPFNTIRLHFVKETDQTGIAFAISVSDIVKLLLSQLGMATQTGSIVNFKLQRIDAFATSAAGDTLRPSVTLEASSVVPQVGDPATPGNAIVHYPVIKSLTDTGSVSKPARVSYSYPLFQRDIPLNSNSNFIVANIASNTKDTDVFFIVQWNTTSVAVPVD